MWMVIMYLLGGTEGHQWLSDVPAQDSYSRFLIETRDFLEGNIFRIRSQFLLWFRESRQGMSTLTFLNPSNQSQEFKQPSIQYNLECNRLLVITQPLFSLLDLTLNLGIPWTKTPLAFYWHVGWNGSTQLGNNFIFPLCNSIIRLKGTYRFFLQEAKGFQAYFIGRFLHPLHGEGLAAFKRQKCPG